MLLEDTYGPTQTTVTGMLMSRLIYTKRIIFSNSICTRYVLLEVAPRGAATNSGEDRLLGPPMGWASWVLSPA